MRSRRSKKSILDNKNQSFNTKKRNKKEKMN